jgi:hypothetical protein
MNIIIGIFLLLLLLSLVIFLKIRDRKLLHTVTRSNRGTKTERALVLKLLKSGVPAITIFHDLYLKKSNGTYSQIDVVVATKVGLIVFEVKDYSGWIFGTGDQRKWTQVLNYGKEKYRFYNPILQNSMHITHLRKQVKQFEKLPIYSVVVFYGDCEFKDISFIPEGTFLIKARRVKKVMKMILREHAQTNYTNKREVVDVLKEAVTNGESKEAQAQHAENIKDMLGRDRIFE